MKNALVFKTNRYYYNGAEAVKDSITIKELKDILENYNEDDKVIFSNDNGYTYGYIDESVIDEQEFETEEERELREKMEELNEELCELQTEYENPFVLEEDSMSDEEYRKSRADIFAYYKITEEEYNAYKF